MSVNTLRAVAMVKAGIITERRSCLSKVSFCERNQALHAAKLIAQKTGRATTIYKCSWCAGYHCTKAKHTGDES